MRVLVIEDDAKTASYLAKGLSESSFVVDVATDGEDGLHLALNSVYDVIVCDVMLPFIDGWTIVKRVREKSLTTPILLLTARDTVADRVRGLELGADDYLVKPFAFSELLARVRAILRRGVSRRLERLTVLDLELDLIRHRATRAGHDLNLSPKEFALLSLLMRRSGEVLSRTIIAEQVWDMNFDSDSNVVDVAVRRLRQKVDDPFDRKLIQTIRGAGYVLEG